MIPFFPEAPSGTAGSPFDVSGCASLALHRMAMLCRGRARLTNRRPEICCVRSHLGAPGVRISTQEAAT